MRFRKARIFWTIGTGLFVCCSAYLYVRHLNASDHLKNPDRVAFILNIPEVPQSVRDIKCSANAITDLIVTCAFQVDPDDFEKLVVGWDFERQNISKSGRTHGMDAAIGPEFQAVTRYWIKPSKFKNGGLVDLVTNKEETLVVANRYEE